jgi:hypothetical protein
MIGLTARHLLNNNPEPEWLEHTDKGTIFISKSTILGLTQQQWLEEMYTTMDLLAGQTYLEFADAAEYIRSFIGPKYRKLVQCYNRTIRSGKLRTGVTSFVKADKYEKVIANTKPPRMIQFRDPGTNCELNRFIEPIENVVLKTRGLGRDKLPDCSKGMNMDERAQLWAKKRACFKDPVAMKADYSKFDAHLHTHMLELTHYLYSRMFRLPKGFMKFQLINRVVTGMIKYTAVGTRMSGDRDTGGGNSLINICIIRTLIRVSGLHVEFLCDGDDSLIWCERKDLVELLKWFDWIPKVCGLKLEKEVALTLEDEEFCHSKLILNSIGEWKCYMDPLRTLQRAFWVVNRDGSRQCGDLFVGILKSNRKVHWGLPMVHPVMEGLLSRVAQIKENARELYTDRWAKQFVDLHHAIPKDGKWEDNDYMRHQVWQYWGYTPEFQRQIEDAYLNATFDNLRFTTAVSGKVQKGDYEKPIDFVNNRAFPWLTGQS